MHLSVELHLVLGARPLRPFRRLLLLQYCEAGTDSARRVHVCVLACAEASLTALTVTLHVTLHLTESLRGLLAHSSVIALFERLKDARSSSSASSSAICLRVKAADHEWDRPVAWPAAAGAGRERQRGERESYTRMPGACCQAAPLTPAPHRCPCPRRTCSTDPSLQRLHAPATAPGKDPAGRWAARRGRGRWRPTAVSLHVAQRGHEHTNQDIWQRPAALLQEMLLGCIGSSRAYRGHT
jgi:hypothetical protein